MTWIVEARERKNENGGPSGLWHMTASSDEGGGFVVGCDHDHSSPAEAMNCILAKEKIGRATGFPAQEIEPGAFLEPDHETVAEMPLYQSHKLVRALRIAAVEIHEDGSATIAPKEEGYGTFKTRVGWGERFGGDDNDPGVFVQYEDGFSSWSPSKVFSEGYLPVAKATAGAGNTEVADDPTFYTFGSAVEALKAGEAVARAGWNGKGMYLFLVSGGDMDHPALPFGAQQQDYIAMRTVSGSVVPWLASQTDVLASDWRSVEVTV